MMQYPLEYHSLRLCNFLLILCCRFQMVADRKERDRLDEAARRRAEVENRIRKYKEQEGKKVFK